MSHIAIGLDTRPGPAFFAGLPGRIDRAADLLTIEDGFGDTEDGLDAMLLANWLGPRTSRIGLLAGAPLNVLEPFHVSTAIATLDYVTQGRAGLFAQPLRDERAGRAGRAIGALDGYPETDPAALAQDLAEAVEVVRLLWDSWEDDAVIRNPVSQRFIDGAKLHYLRYKGSRFSVLGPSITPRPPQGQPVVATSLRPGGDLAAAAHADLVFLEAPDEDAVRTLAASLRGAGRPLLFADVLFGREAGSDRHALCWTGEPPATWAERLDLAGLRVRPDVPERDLGALLDVLPSAASRAGTLRDRLGLAPAPNRHVLTAPAA